MKLTIILQQTGTPGESQVEINIGSKADTIPAMQVQDAIAEIGAQLLDAIINAGKAKNYTTAEDMLTITIGELAPIAVSIKETPVPHELINNA